MASRSAKFKHGGKVFYSGGESNTAKEARQKRASGGKACAMPGGKSGSRYARGGSVYSSAGGGSADKSPYSSAHGKK